MKKHWLRNWPRIDIVSNAIYIALAYAAGLMVNMIHFWFSSVDTDDMDFSMAPSKRVYNHTLSTSSASTCSSPENNFDSVHLSFDDDSGSDNSFVGASTSVMSPITVSNPNSFFYDSRHSQTFSFLKPRYVAPPSPLAAGVHSASINNESKKNAFTGTNYTFTPVKDWYNFII